LLEEIGRDLVRTLLVHQNLKLLPALSPLLAAEGATQMKVKKFSAENDTVIQDEEAYLVNRMLIAELNNNKELIKMGEGDSSSGSDSEPSEDNLEPSELIKNLPTVDKNLSQALKKQQTKKPEKPPEPEKRVKSPMKNSDGKRATSNPRDDNSSPLKNKKTI
jgi:hypothetical protein